MMIICAIIIMVLILVIKKCFKFKNPKRCRIICLIIVCVLVFANIDIIISKKLEFDLATKNAITIEGPIENFHTSQNGVESFYIGDEFFEYPLFESFIGYSYPKRDLQKSVISGEGQYVKLTYYKTRDNNNAIIKIESDSIPKKYFSFKHLWGD